MGKLREQTSATKPDESSDKEKVAAVGQGELYSPDYALKIQKPEENTQLRKEKVEKSRNREEGNNKQKMVVVNLRGLNLAVIKEKVLEKMAAAAVPSDALENARHFLESVVREVAVAAQGLTKDALHRIKTHLVDILPSLSPAVTRKIVDDAEKEAKGEAETSGGEEKERDEQKVMGKSTYMTPASSFFSTLARPFSRL